MGLPGKVAILIGATGLTGRYLLDILLESEEYTQVKTFTRRPIGKIHPNLTEVVCNLLELGKQANMFVADEVFCCIGTTQKKTPDRQLYQDVDRGIPTMAAKLSEKNNIKTFSVISALGANNNSPIFYSRTKGEMEQLVLACDIPNILIYRPSLIYGERSEMRLGEVIGGWIMRGLQGLMIGALARYRPIHTKHLAQAIYNGRKKIGKHIIQKDDFIVS